MINYFVALLAEDDAAFNWIRPIPKPPTAPASNPSITKTGMLSRMLFFIFAMTQLSLCNSFTPLF
jgi:hypothetical protein